MGETKSGLGRLVATGRVERAVKYILGTTVGLLSLAAGAAIYTSGPSEFERMEPRSPEPSYDEVLAVPVSAGRSVPPTNHVVNHPAGEEVDVLQSEVSIAVHGDTIVIGWNDGAAFESEKNTGTGYDPHHAFPEPGDRRSN